MGVHMDIMVDYHDSTSVAQKLKLIPDFLSHSKCYSKHKARV